MESTIKIKRDSGLIDMGRAYKVFLDEKQIGEIENGKEVALKVPSGVHEIFLKIDWCQSKKINFEILPGEMIGFACGSNFRGFKMLFASLGSFLFRNNYIWLKLDK